MRTSVLLILVLLLIIFASFVGYYLGYQRLLPRITFVPAPSPTSIPSRVGGVAATAVPSVSVTSAPTPSILPTTVVDDFMKSFTQIQTNNTNDSNAQNALTYLTTDAQKVVNQQSSGNIGAGLAKFANVQSVPEGGYTLGKPATTNNSVTIATTWNYLSGSITKVFYLKNQDGQWKIDSIQEK